MVKRWLTVCALLCALCAIGQAPYLNHRRTASRPQPTSGFSPDSISGLIRWYKADAITGYSDGKGLSNWVDSTSTFNTTEIAGVTAPTYRTGIFGSLAGVLFTNNCALNMGKPAVNTNKSFTIFMVYKRADMGSLDTIADWQNNTAGEEYRHKYSIRDDANNDIWIQNRALTTLFVSGDPSGTHQIMSQGSQSGGFAASKDQGTESTEVKNLMANDSSNASRLGYSQGDDQFFTGYVAEILFYNSVLGTTDKGNVGAYLKDKWGTP